MTRIAALATVAAGAALALSPTGPASTPPTSGLFGTVRRGPIMPVCKADVPCDQPAANVTLVFSRAGRVVARTRTKADGRYRVTLAAGIYAVRTNRPVFERTPRPSRATVVRFRYRRINFFIDTGIR
jgi:hypothetical protein